MKHHSIVCRLGLLDNVKIKLSRSDTQTTELSFIDGYQRLEFGLGQALNQLNDMGLTPSERAIDLALLAAVLTAADTRISRASESQDVWTREIDLHVPVAEPELWQSVAPLLINMLNFLTGDKWGFYFRARPSNLKTLAIASTKLPTLHPSCVCLFSGGLDSFIGAIDLLKESESPLFVSHYWDGVTSSYQTHCYDVLAKYFRSQSINHIRARVGFPNDLIDDSKAENTLRGRSFLFFALAALSADAIRSEMVIHVPENGLISLNVPLDPVRLGALSTRTTHPYYMARFNQLLHELEMPMKLENRYRHQTKGAMAKGCQDLDFLKQEAKNTMSCSSPAKARWAVDETQRQPKHCGHCVPCLIRRAAILEGWGVDDTLYQISNLHAKTLDSSKAEGNHVRSFFLALSRLKEKPIRAKFDIHRPGPLTDYPKDFAAYEAVYINGLNEVGRLLKGVTAKPR